MAMIHRTHILALLLLCSGLTAGEPPVVPVGLDAYRQWDRWPYQRIGVRAYMRSTYDRRGGNEGADASHFLYQLAEDRNVALDVQGPGILYFTRYNHWHGSPWHYDVDGLDHIVQETSTADPLHPKAGSVFLPEPLFPSPLTATWSTTQGADLSWVPIPFEKSFRLAYSRTHYGTGYFIYHQFVPGTRLSQPIESWNERSVPDPAVLDLLARAGSDLLETPNSREAAQFQTRSSELSVKSSETRLLTQLTNAPSMLRSLQFSVSKEQALAFGKCRLRIFWDGLPTASVDAPVALFFGAGTLYNRDNREYLVKAFPVNIRFTPDKVILACYFPMPFFHSARIELLNETETPVALQWSVRFAPFKGTQDEVGYFHATYRDHANSEPGRDLVLLDTQESEGGGDWSGQFVGISFIFSDGAVLNTLEGDPRFFFDDSQTPQAYGTGTEEWAGGGDYWGGRNMTLAFAGHPTGARSTKEALCDEDKIESAYRFLLADLMPFGKRARIQLEHGGQDESTEHYQTVAYWYGINSPSLVKTDELKIGDPASESAHSYFAPEATAPYSITSRYEWGVDTLNGKEIYPATTDIGRRTTGTSEFTLNLAPGNLGVLLRRKLDYQYPNQRAEVFVAPVKNGRVTGAFQPSGVWYLAGGNTCVYSNPKEELGPAQHIAQTSNRRFRDDEFLVPRTLTQAREVIRIRIKFTPVRIPLYPGQEPPEAAWTELKYEAFCFVMPKPRR
jgi:hypothetical protein